MMKRTLILAAALVGLASAADAASVVVTSNQAVYTVGDTITLTVTGTANAGEVTTQVFGLLLLSSGNGGTVSGSGPAVQTALVSFGAIPWTIGGAAACDSTSCVVMNQLIGVTPFPVSNTPLAIATLSYTAATPGTVDLNFLALTFDFFGAALPATSSFNIVPIPEPTTAAMLGLGILGLTLAGRRRA